jgi:cell division septum initiation protein DivIVA
MIDAEITNLHKEQEQIRQLRDRLESLDASLKELIQKGNQASEAIVQSSREMRNRLLA